MEKPLVRKRSTIIDHFDGKLYNQFMSERVTETVYDRLKSKWEVWKREHTLALRGGHELTPKNERIVIFGGNVSGAAGFGGVLNMFLEDHPANVSVEFTRHANHVGDLFYGRTRENPDAAPTIPRGVIVFPDEQMTQISPEMAPNMRVDTPLEHIMELCDRHGVPLVRIEKDTTPEAMLESLGALAARDVPAIEPRHP